MFDAALQQRIVLLPHGGGACLVRLLPHLCACSLVPLDEVPVSPSVRVALPRLRRDHRTLQLSFTLHAPALDGSVARLPLNTALLGVLALLDASVGVVDVAAAARAAATEARALLSRHGLPHHAISGHCAPLPARLLVLDAPDEVLAAFALRGSNDGGGGDGVVVEFVRSAGRGAATVTMHVQFVVAQLCGDILENLALDSGAAAALCGSVLEGSVLPPFQHGFWAALSAGLTPRQLSGSGRRQRLEARLLRRRGDIALLAASPDDATTLFSAAHSDAMATGDVLCAGWASQGLASAALLHWCVAAGMGASEAPFLAAITSHAADAVRSFDAAAADVHFSRAFVGCSALAITARLSLASFLMRHAGIPHPVRASLHKSGCIAAPGAVAWDRVTRRHEAAVAADVSDVGRVSTSRTREEEKEEGEEDDGEEVEEAWPLPRALEAQWLAGVADSSSSSGGGGSKGSGAIHVQETTCPSKRTPLSPSSAAAPHDDALVSCAPLGACGGLFATSDSPLHNAISLIMSTIPLCHNVRPPADKVWCLLHVSSAAHSTRVLRRKAETLMLIAARVLRLLQQQPRTGGGGGGARGGGVSEWEVASPPPRVTRGGEEGEFTGAQDPSSRCRCPYARALCASAAASLPSLHLHALEPSHLAAALVSSVAIAQQPWPVPRTSPLGAQGGAPTSTWASCLLRAPLQRQAIADYFSAGENWAAAAVVFDWVGEEAVERERMHGLASGEGVGSHAGRRPLQERGHDGLLPRAFSLPILMPPSSARLVSAHSQISSSSVSLSPCKCCCCRSDRNSNSISNSRHSPDFARGASAGAAATPAIVAARAGVHSESLATSLMISTSCLHTAHLWHRGALLLATSSLRESARGERGGGWSSSPLVLLSLLLEGATWGPYATQHGATAAHIAVKAACEEAAALGAHKDVGCVGREPQRLFSASACPRGSRQQTDAALARLGGGVWPLPEVGLVPGATPVVWSAGALITHLLTAD